jgi:hypothetical protein
MSFTINSFRQLYQLYDITKQTFLYSDVLVHKNAIRIFQKFLKIENVGQRISAKSTVGLKQINTFYLSK